MSRIGQVIAQITSILDSVASVACSLRIGEGDLQPETSTGAVTVAKVETGNGNSCKKWTKFHIYMGKVEN